MKTRSLFSALGFLTIQATSQLWGQQLAPFNGFRFVVPATIECELYDKAQDTNGNTISGENLAYHDLTASNDGGGGKFRAYVNNDTLSYPEGVDLFRCSYFGGARGYCIANAFATEWTKYSITVPESATYTVEIRARIQHYPQTAGKIRISVNDGYNHSTGDLTVWNYNANWQTLVGSIYLPAGDWTLKFEIISGDSTYGAGVFDYITVYKTPNTISVPANTISLVAGSGANDLWSGNSQAAADHNRDVLQTDVNNLVYAGGGNLILPSGGPYYLRQSTPSESLPLGSGTCECCYSAIYNYAVYIGGSNVKIQGSGSGANQTTLQAWNRVTSLFYVGDWDYYGFPTLNQSISNIVFQGVTFKGNPTINSLGTYDTYGVERRNLCPPVPLVTQVTAGMTRSDFTGWVGLKLTVGNRPLVVMELGRWRLSGNTQAHTVKLVTSTGADVPGGSVTIDNSTQGLPDNQFNYANLASPVTLSANTQYYVVSHEVSGGDEWLDWDTAVTTTMAATVNGAAYEYEGAYYGPYGSSQSYVPVNLIYTESSNPMSDLGSLIVFYGDFNINNPAQYSFIQNIKVDSCTFTDPSNVGVYFSYVKDATFQNNTFNYFNNMTPDVVNNLLAWVAINGPSGRNEDIYVFNNTFNGNTSMQSACDYAADGLVWLGNGGKWVVKGNTIQNYRLEAVALNAGPYTVVENTFNTVSRGGSSTALDTSHNSNETTISSAASINSTYCFVNNSVVGGVTGVLGPVPSNPAFPSGPFNMVISANSFSLPTSTCFGTSPTVAVGLEYCEAVTICGNTIAQAGRALQYNNYANHYVNGVGMFGANCSFKVLCNDFKNSEWDSFLLQDAPNKMQAAEFVANLLGDGWTGYHLYLTFSDPLPNPFVPPTLVIKGNQFWQGSTQVSYAIYPQNPPSSFYTSNPATEFADSTFSLY